MRDVSMTQCTLTLSPGCRSYVLLRPSWKPKFQYSMNLITSVTPSRVRVMKMERPLQHGASVLCARA